MGFLCVFVSMIPAALSEGFTYYPLFLLVLLYGNYCPPGVRLLHVLTSEDVATPRADVATAVRLEPIAHQ